MRPQLDAIKLKSIFSYSPRMFAFELNCNKKHFFEQT